MATIEEVNQDDSIHGVLMFRPLPKHLDEEACCQALDPEKDVDEMCIRDRRSSLLWRSAAPPSRTPTVPLVTR